MGPTFYRLTSLYSLSIGHPIPEIRLFQNLTLKIQGWGHGWGQSWKSQSGCNILSTHIPFVPCQLTLLFLRYGFQKVWLKPCFIWQVLVHGHAHMGQMGKGPGECTTTGLDNSTELRMEKIRQAVTEIWVSQICQLPKRLPRPWWQHPYSPESWGVKINTSPH